MSLSLHRLHKHFYEFDKEILDGKRNKKWSRSLQKGKSLDRSLIAPDIESLDWALAGKLVLFSSGIDWKVDVKAPSNIKSWNHCNRDLIVILPNGLADSLDIELLEL